MNKKLWVKIFLAVVLIPFLTVNGLFLTTSLGLNCTEQMVHFKRDWIRNSENFYKDSLKTNILILGDSTTTSGVLPNVFNDEKFNVYNLSIVSHDIIKLKFILKDFIKNNFTPDYIIFNISNKRKYSQALNSSFDEALYFYNLGGVS